MALSYSLSFIINLMQCQRSSRSTIVVVYLVSGGKASHLHGLPVLFCPSSEATETII